jgi:hypothetical protein
MTATTVRDRSTSRMKSITIAMNVDIASDLVGDAIIE